MKKWKGNMPKPLKEQFVKEKIVNWLFRNGWGRNLRIGELRKPGVDIRVRHNEYARYFLIETKGEGKSRQVDDGTFVNGLGQLITRMETGAKYRYGLGLPYKSADIALKRVPWQIAKKLWLSIFSVDKKGKVKHYEWKEIKEFQIRNNR
ncbi:MAG: hypothetical protein L0Z48_12980 [candidate division Zixibacteria bacterium]|nr:hypothetical protein [candidate division Zixibacteria bacterium]